MTKTGILVWVKYKNSSIQEEELQTTPVNAGSKGGKEHLRCSGHFRAFGQRREAPCQPWALSPAKWNFLLVTCFSHYFNTLPTFPPCFLSPSSSSSSLFAHVCSILCTFLSVKEHMIQNHPKQLGPGPPRSTRYDGETVIHPAIDKGSK